MRATALNLAGEFAAALGQALRAQRFYPEGHPERARFLHRTQELWTECLRQQLILVIESRVGLCEVSPHGSFELTQPLQLDLLTALRERGLARIRLVSAEDPLRLIEALRSPQQVKSAINPIAASPPRATADTDGDRLLAVWAQIRHKQTLAAELFDPLIVAVARLPGDGLIEPVQLRQARDVVQLYVDHALNVARLMYLTARALRAPAELTRSIVAAALLADIGMIEVPGALLAQTNSLSPEEFHAIRQHPWHGALWLLATPEVGELAGVLAFEHHVRSDGQGYPFVPRHWKLHALTPIFQVVDTYAALRSRRAHRAAIPEAAARQLLKRLSSRWLDAAAVELVLNQAAPQGLCLAEEVPALV